jgi:hypothetical protein
VASVSPQMPSPPFPDPDSAMLSVVVSNGRDALERGEDPLTVLLNVAVHGWMEGHIEGERYCAAGCNAPAEPGREEFAVAMRHAPGGSERIAALFAGERAGDLTPDVVEAGRLRAVEQGHLEP